MKGKLTKVSGTERSGPVRTDSFDCEFEYVPEVGRQFIGFGEPINPEADMRIWSTSPAVSVNLKGDMYEFETATGSKYILKVEK